MKKIRTKVTDFFSFAIGFSLELESELHVNQFLLVTFTILGALMPQSYSIIPKYIQSKNTSFYQAVAKIVRPNLILPQNEQVYSLSLLIIAILIVLKYIIIFYFFTNQQDQLKQKKFFKVITFMNQIYDIWLYNPILELLLFSTTNLFGLPIILYILFLIYRLTITKAQLIVQSDSFNTFKPSILTYLSQILNTIQIFLFRNNSDIQGNITFYSMIIGLLINVISVINIKLNAPYLNVKIANIAIAIHCNSFVYSLCCLIYLRTEVLIETIEISAIIVLPFFFKIVEHYSFTMLLLTLIEQNNPHRLINLIIYLRQDSNNDKKRILLESIACITSGLSDFYERITVKHQELTKNNLISHLSFLLLLNQYFKAYLCISREKSLRKQTFLNKIKLQILGNKCKEKLNYHMMVENNVDVTQENIISLEKFMSIETKNLELFQSVQKHVIAKISFLKTFQSLDNDKLYRESINLVNQLEILLAKVKEVYQEHPTQKNQNVIALIYAELLNDYLSANKTVQLSGVEDESFFRNQTNTKLNIYSVKTAYIVVNLDDYKIIRNSNNALDFLKVDQLILNDLIPNGIREYHPAMIENFIKTGKSKFFRNVENGLFIQDGLIEGVSMQLEITFQHQQLHALMILSLQELNQIIMVVDNHFKIAGLSSEFLAIVGAKPEQIELIYDIPIHYVIPKFKYCVQDTNTIENLEVRFLTTNNLFDYLSLLILQKGEKNIHDLMDQYWLESSNYDIYKTICKISNHNSEFYIVRFNYLKNQSKSNSATQIRTKTIIKTIVQPVTSDIKYNESVNKLLPYEDVKEEITVQKEIEQFHQSAERLFSYREQSKIELLEEQSKSNYYLKKTKNEQKSSHKSVEYNQMVSIKQSKQKSHFYKNEEQENVSKDEKESKENEIGGRSSQASCIARQNKAIFYKKYVLVEKMIESQNINQVSKIFMIMVLLQTFVLILQVLISLIATKDTFTSYLTNIDLLQIKYYLFAPLESFIVTRYTIINYNAQYAAKTITSKQLKNYLTFPNSNLNLGFDDVQNNLAEILNRLTLQDFLAQEHEIYIYTNTNIGELYLITMRQTLSILVNYQYTFKAAYIYDGKTVSDSPYIYYSYRNLLVLYDAFDSLNQNLYQQNLFQIESDKDKELKMFYPFVITIIFLIVLQIFWLLRSQSKISALIGLLKFTESSSIQKDIERLTLIAEDINRHHDHLFKYNFHLERREVQLQIQQKQMSAQRLQYKKQNLSNKKAYVLILIQLILIMSFTIAKYSINLNYFIKFGPTSYFYQQVTDLGSNVPTIYAMREVLYYRWRYPFYTTNDTDNIMIQIQNCISQMQNVTSFIQSLRSDNYLFSSEFFANLSAIESSNICNLLSSDMYTKSESLCGITMAGSFLNGLTGSLIYIYQSIYTEMQINQFLNKTTDTINELEGAFIMSQVIKELNTHMKSDLTAQTNIVFESVIIISLLALLYAVISMLILWLLIYPFLKRQYYMSKRFLYLVPQQTLFLDDVFERVARTIMQEQQIIH